MGRPPLRVGTHGNISYRILGPRKVRAMAHVRDVDGRRREVTAQAGSKAAARAELQARIAARVGIGRDLTGESLLSDVAAAWIAEVDRQVAAGERAPNTGRLYRSALTTHILPGVGQLRVAEATAPRLNAFVVAMRTHHRGAITKTTRTVLNGILGHAVRAGAAATNPMRDVARVPGDRVKVARALTQVERDRWIVEMEADVVAVRHDLPDLTRMMLATGVRIGECLALSFDDVDVDGKTVAVDWNIVRITGVGLRRMRTKSSAGVRTLRLPGWAVDLVAGRGDRAGWRGPLFPAIGRPEAGRWRDPSNTSRALREASDRAGFGWVTSHVFRKTVATVLDESGLSAREIADQLGHAKVSMTQDVYMGRHAGGTGAAVALEDVFGAGPGEK